MNAPMPCLPAAAGWPPEACRPPSWHLWETTLASGRKITTESPLVDFHEWRLIARERIERDGVKQAAVFGDGWRHGASRLRRRVPPASSPRPSRLPSPTPPVVPPSASQSVRDERPAEPGELCTCGRPARVVFTGGRHGDVGYCGLSGVAPVVPCPFCGAGESHREPGVTRPRCPGYRLRPAMEGGVSS